MKRERSEQLYQKALNYFPGGVNSPVRAFRSVGGTPLFIEKEPSNLKMSGAGRPSVISGSS